MILIETIRTDRAIQFARRALKQHLRALQVFDRNAAVELLRLDGEAGRLDAAVEAATPAGAAKAKWRTASAAVALGNASEEQAIIAGQPLETYRAHVADVMHGLKSSRSVVRDALRKSLQKAFLSPEGVLRQLADQVEADYQSWCQDLGVAADRCSLGDELRALAPAGWQWDSSLDSSPLADGGEIRRLLESAAT